ncbi:MAG: hypothetical protein ABIA37_00305 [Candidatus Woesearchaeota archaeon]
MKKKRSNFQKSWNILMNNKILFAPNLLILAVNFLLFGLLLYLTGTAQALIENNSPLLIASFFSFHFLIYFLVYLLLISWIDNFFLAAKYGMIKEVLLKGKTNLHSGFSFGIRYYFQVLHINIITYAIIFVPLLLAFYLLFYLLPLSSLAAFSLFLPVLIIYLAYITLRLLFIYPVMAFHHQGAYHSLKEDFHYVKTHLHHSFLTWLVVVLILAITAVLKQNLLLMSNLLYQQIFYLGLLGTLLIFLIEILVSVWEHIYLFRAYLSKK